MGPQEILIRIYRLGEGHLKRPRKRAASEPILLQGCNPVS